jgi:hypothetical protein
VSNDVQTATNVAPDWVNHWKKSSVADRYPEYTFDGLRRPKRLPEHENGAPTMLTKHSREHQRARSNRGQFPCTTSGGGPKFAVAA